jgi:hypothetical protein
MVETRGGVVCIYHVEDPSLDGMSLRGLGNGHVLMHSCITGATSGAVVASIVGLVRGFSLF